MTFEVELIKREVEEGWTVIKESVPLGKKYTVDLESMRLYTILNPKRRRKMVVPMVLDINTGKYLPVSIFRFPNEAILAINVAFERIGYVQDGENRSVH